MISLTTDDKFVTIHVEGASNGDGGRWGDVVGRRGDVGGTGGRWGDGGTLGGRGDVGGTGGQRGDGDPYTRSIEDIILISLRRCDVDVSRCQSQ